MNGIYKDFAEILGYEVTVLIFKYFKGLQVTFPTKILSKEYVREKILEEYSGDNIKTLARRYEYSERWIRKIIKSEKKKYNQTSKNS